MLVRDLKKLLDDVDDDAHVVVGGKVATGIEQVQGRVGGERHASDVFRRAAKGRDKALTFLTDTEFSDGSRGPTSRRAQE